jgi:hypothetical protein
MNSPSDLQERFAWLCERGYCTASLGASSTGRPADQASSIESERRAQHRQQYAYSSHSPADEH